VGIKFSNNGEGTLVTGISDSIDTLELNSGDGVNFPVCGAGQTDYFYTTLVNLNGDREIIKVIQRTGDVFDEIERGQDGTTPRAFVQDDKVQLRLPKIILEEYRDDIAANLAAIGTNDTDITNLQARDTADEQVLYAPSGLTLYIYNPAGEIPTGWSAKSGPADCLLAIKGGSAAYNVAGENLRGSWTPTGHVHTGPSHVHTGPSHVHTMPSHVHTGPSHSHTVPDHNHAWYLYYGGAADDQTYNSDGVAGVPTTHTNAGFEKLWWSTNNALNKLGQTSYTNKVTGVTTGSDGTGNTGSTDPGDTNASGTANTGASGTANSGSSKEPSTDRPYAAVGLLIERD
jgi:hypothetical protein